MARSKKIAPLVGRGMSVGVRREPKGQLRDDQVSQVAHGVRRGNEGDVELLEACCTCGSRP